MTHIPTPTAITVSIPARGAQTYPIHIGSGLRRRVGEMISRVHTPCRTLLLTDDTVAALYAETVTASLSEAGFSVVRHVIPHGEASKSAANLMALLEAMADEHLDRKSVV